MRKVGRSVMTQGLVSPPEICRTGQRVDSRSPPANGQDFCGNTARPIQRTAELASSIQAARSREYAFSDKAIDFSPLLVEMILLSAQHDSKTAA